MGVSRLVESPTPGVVQPKAKGMPTRCTVLPMTLKGTTRTVTMATACTLPRMSVIVRSSAANLADRILHCGPEISPSMSSWPSTHHEIALTI